MELISFLGKLFGYTPEIANVISVGGASFRFRKERHPPRMVFLFGKGRAEITTKN